ncbi:hypothetical protein NSA19_13555 [Actinomyces bowdenii]|uniref:hypothetical protein n=1 Tax=Actinomyces bowdenii TaxID=131109 RepID=UPI00214B50C6|nr:hypothetical protein [Actinomyces bowdenii]
MFEYEGCNPLENAVHLEGTVGIAGSGKKSWKTANISTAAILIATAGGARIVKAVSGATSSVCGSADMFRLLGSSPSHETHIVLEQLDKTGIGIVEIEHIIPRFNSVYNGLFFAPHLLSLGLPALTIPFDVDSFCYGIAHPSVDLSRKVIERYRPVDVTTVACRVADHHWIDELTTIGVNKVSRSNSGPRPDTATVGDDVNGVVDKLQRCNDLERVNRLSGASTAAAQRELLLGILHGTADRELLNTVALNAALLIELATRRGFADCFDVAVSVIREGAALATLDRYVRLTKSAD